MVDMTRRYRQNDNCNFGCNRGPEPRQRGNDMGMQMNCSSCDSLKKKLQTVDFAIIETVLFLDAYPKNMQALEYYHKLIGERKLLEKAINEKCGPITNMSNESRTEWNWVSSPWPWEADAN